MPLYEYRCASCGAQFDLLRPFSKVDAPAPCPQCHGGETQRAISRFACFSTAGDGSSSAIAGGGGCAGCSASSCEGCRH